MTVYVLLTLLFAISGAYFAFRYFSLKHALKEIWRDLSEIRQNLSINQILHLPLPDNDLERLIQSVNATLEEVRLERQSYEKREAEFQKLIENISHDLRTPLTVILGYLKWMRKAGGIHGISPGQNQRHQMDSYAESSSHADIHRSDVYRADAHLADVPDTGLYHTDVHRSDIPDTDIYRADAHLTDVPDMNLYCTDAHLTDVPNTDVYRADIHMANVPNTDTYHADVHLTDVPDTDTYHTDVLRSDVYCADPLDILEKNARTMEALVSQFYDFSRLNARDYTLELQEVDVCRILKESLATNYQILEEAHLSLNCHLPDHPVAIRGNTSALERIFSNLFQNAGRYAHSVLDIRLEETDNGQVTITFQNDSEPITEDELSHLFDRFYKNDSSRHRNGSGLGLTVARSLAKLIGGTLTAALSDLQLESPEPDSVLAAICFTLILKADSKDWH